MNKNMFLSYIIRVKTGKLQYRCVCLVKTTSINKVIRTQNLVNRGMQNLLFSIYQLFQINIKERREIKNFFHKMR